MQTSAGILLYRGPPGHLEVLLAHPGGPHWRNRDQWGIPKGRVEAWETPLQAAVRETWEETGILVPMTLLTPLGCRPVNPYKQVHVWVAPYDVMPDLSQAQQITVEGETFLECDRVEWLSWESAQQRMFPGQRVFLGLLEELLKGPAASP